LQLHAQEEYRVKSILLNGKEVGHTVVWASEELGIAICLVTEHDRKPHCDWDTGEPKKAYEPPLRSLRTVYFSDLNIDICSPVLMQLEGKVEIFLEE
jgi:hypothetical protein